MPNAKPPILGARALNRAGLARQMLLERAAVGPLDALERLFAVQAQSPKAPFLGLWSRLAGFRHEALTRLVDERRVVRATFLRGTLHLLRSGDFLSLRAALQPGLAEALKVLRERGQGLDAARLLAAGEAFFERGPAEFEALREHLAPEHPGGDLRAMAYLIRTQLPLVQAPDEGPFRFSAGGRFALARSFLGAPPAADARPEHLVLRYLVAYGPAAIADAQAWLGLKGLKAAFETLRPELVTFCDERGRELFDLPGGPRPDPDTPAPPRFLPEFDGLMLGWHERSRVLADEHRGRVATKNLLVPAVLLLDGCVAGLWKTERKRGIARLLVGPFGRLTKAMKANVETEGLKLLAFLEPEAKSYEASFAA